MRHLVFILLGYLSGSVLYARVFGKVFRGVDITEGTADQNPGTANAFKNGGMACGIATLVCEIAKGFLPVYLYSHTDNPAFLALVLLSPVLGHIEPIFFGFQGGKGIAVTFGCLLGLVPDWVPVLNLAAWFLLFALVIRIKPDFYKTLAAFSGAAVTLFFLSSRRSVLIGFVLMAAAVMLRLHRSTEKRSIPEVTLLWKH